MRRTFQSLLAPRAMLVLGICLAGQGILAEDLFFYLPFTSVISRDKFDPISFGANRDDWRTESWVKRASLDGEGEIYVHVSNQGEEFIAARVPAGKPVTGRIFAVPKAPPIPFSLAAEKATRGARAEFFETRRRHYELLRDEQIPGAAWFRHQESDSAKAKGSNIVVRGDQFQFRGRRGPFDGEGTLDLFSGGRAVSENLQLDRVLRTTTPAPSTIDITTLQGITVQEMDWTSLLKGNKPTLDSLARYIPGDQHAIFFPSFNAMTAMMDEADAALTPMLHLLEPRSEDATTRQRYQKQLGLELNEISRALGPRIISSVAMTGSDPYLVSGSDVAVLFETKSPNVLNTYLAARHSGLKQTNTAVKAVQGEVEGVAFAGVQSPDRSVSSFVAMLDDAVFVSNSRYQLEALIKTAKGKTTALAAQADYAFFRTRYAKSERDEAAFLILTDATIRRWCGPRWRIGNSRRVQVAALLSELQAEHLNEIARHPTQARRIQAPAGAVETGELTSAANGVRSSIYGDLEFQTPICELPLDKVSLEEQNSYNAWRSSYQQYWRQYFDPIAVRVTMNPQQIAAQITVMPLIAGTDYRDMVDFTRGGRIAPEAGDRHAESVMHFAMAVNHESRLMHEAQGLFNSPNSPVRANPLGWLGSAISIYGDRDPFWENLGKAVNVDRFLKTNYYSLPLALQVEVKNPLGLAAFLTALRSKVEETAPGMARWENVDYNGQTYVRVTPAIPQRGNNDEEDMSLVRFSVYYAVSPKSLTLTINEALLKRALDRHPAGNSKRAEPAGDATGKPWMGTNLCLQLDREFLRSLEKLSSTSERTSQQRLAWNNIPILNEWKRLYPSEDPVKFHERVWKTSLICPGGGSYVWNEKWRTMESTVYGHPGEPKESKDPQSRLGKFSSINLGLSFENQGLSAQAVLDRDKAR